MSTKMANGLLFIIAGLAPLVIYMGLGPDGGDILDASMTERVATWFIFSMAIALMMTKDTMQGGSGYHLANAGFIIVVIASGAGIVVDAFNGAEKDAYVEILGPNIWSSFMLGMFITALGYYIQKNFPIWLSGLGMVVTAAAFIVFGFEVIDVSDPTEVALIPIWIGFTLVAILYGVFTIRKTD